MLTSMICFAFIVVPSVGFPSSRSTPGPIRFSSSPPCHLLLHFIRLAAEGNKGGFWTTLEDCTGEMAGVPKFGNWENDGSVPYTQYFERARKGKGGAKATPEEGNGSVATDAPPVQPPPARTKASPNPAHATGANENAPRKTVGWDAGKTPSDSQSTAPRTGTRSGSSVENSPLSQHTPGRFAGKAGSASPYQSKVPPEHSHDFAPTTPGRSRLQQNDQIPEKVTAVPKFGDWDASDPSGGAGFTEVFKRVKDERNNPSKKAPYITQEPEYIHLPPRANSRSWSWLSCLKGK